MITALATHHGQMASMLKSSEWSKLAGVPELGPLRALHLLAVAAQPADGLDALVVDVGQVGRDAEADRGQDDRGEAQAPVGATGVPESARSRRPSAGPRARSHACPSTPSMA